MYGPFGILHIGVPQEPSYELSSAKQVLPGGKAPWGQTNGSIPLTQGKPEWKYGKSSKFWMGQTHFI